MKALPIILFGLMILFIIVAGILGDLGYQFSAGACAICACLLLMMLGGGGENTGENS